MEGNEVVSMLAFTLVPGVILLVTMLLGLVHQREEPTISDSDCYDGKCYNLDPMIMCLADVSVSEKPGD